MKPQKIPYRYLHVHVHACLNGATVRHLLTGTGSRPKLPSAVADQPRLADNKERADKEDAKPKKQSSAVDAELTSSSDSDEPVDVGA